MTIENAINQLEKAALVDEGYIAIVDRDIPFFCKAANIHDAPSTEMASFVNANRLFSSAEECYHAVEVCVRKFNENIDEINRMRELNGLDKVCPRSIDTYLLKIAKVRYTRKVEVVG